MDAGDHPAMGNGLKAEFQLSPKAGLLISAGEFQG
jgi:hypothetical protein